MNNTEAREKIIEIITEKKKVTAQEISYQTKGKIPTVQVFTIAKKLLEEGVLTVEQTDKNKFFSFANKLNTATPSETNMENLTEQKNEVKTATGKRDLRKFKFNGEELNKGRLALAIIKQYAKEKKPSLKAALELFPEDIVKPYGFLKVVSEARKISKERARFFIKEEEQVKLKDATICVSNQMTPERIERVISIARKTLKYSIK